MTRSLFKSESQGTRRRTTLKPAKRNKKSIHSVYFKKNSFIISYIIKEEEQWLFILSSSERED